MELSLKLLQIFRAVVDARSFTKAAAALSVTQPAISRGVRELESRAGVPLLVRGPGKVRLTEAGDVLLAHARVILDAARAAEDDIAALHGLTRGTLRVGASSTIATYLLPPVLQAFHARHPGVELRLTTSPSRFIAELLVNRDLDVALVEAPVRDPRLAVEFWRDDELVVVVAPTHRLARASGPVQPVALERELLVMRELGSGTRDIVVAGLKKAGVRPRQIFDADSTEAIKQIVAAGLGVAIVSRAAIVESLALRRLVIVDVDHLRIRRPLNRLIVQGGWQTAAVQAFGAVLRAPIRSR
jgi:DNA-binding transcriptional LysR family regulator